MKGIIYESFGGELYLRDLPEPEAPDHGAVIRVMATGLCRSDWHGWMGHDPDIRLPHVPGHELAGVIETVGTGVRNWKPGDRVTLPFVCGCGTCPQCASGNHQVCDTQFQPGFTHWGSFAEKVAVHYADINLVKLPDSMDFVTAAALGCRFVTSFRGVADQGRAAPGEWVAVHGCGGVGLSAIMIARAMGCRTVAVDIDEEKLDFARSLGADETVNGKKTGNTADTVRELTRGGAHLSIDALGSPETCLQSILSLRKRGRHVQIGLTLSDQSRPPVPMDRIVAWELELYGSHGIQAHRYPALLEMIDAGRLHPEKLVTRRIALSEAAAALPAMNSFPGHGVTVIDRFS